MAAAPVARRRVVVAILYGSSCHIAFAVAVGAMMVVLFSGMTKGLGRVPAPWAGWVDAGLLLQFPMLHSALLTRRGSGILPRLAPCGLGRPLATTTYALIASLQTGMLFLAWTPSRHVLWQAEGSVRTALALLYAGAWLLLLKAIADAGIALQTGFLGWWAAARGKAPVYPPVPTKGLFRLCRQPIYVAFALTLWTVPTVTSDGLALTAVLTAYCVLGPRLKEARFARRFGAAFDRYRARVPYWLPWPRRAGNVAAPASE